MNPGGPGNKPWNTQKTTETLKSKNKTGYRACAYYKKHRPTPNGGFPLVQTKDQTNVSEFKSNGPGNKTDRKSNRSSWLGAATNSKSHASSFTPESRKIGPDNKLRIRFVHACITVSASDNNKLWRSGWLPHVFTLVSYVSLHRRKTPSELFQ